MTTFVSAWTINQLSRFEPDAVRDLLNAGDALRKEQKRLLREAGKPDSLRDALAKERIAINSLTERARSTIERAGRPVTDATLQRIAATLQVAAVENEGRELLKAGRLTADLEPTGFGAFTGVEFSPTRSGSAHDELSDRRRQKEEHQQRVSEAQQKVRELDEAARIDGASEIWIFVLFLIYVTATEVSTLFGDGELVKILFRGRSSDLKLTRAAQSAGAMRSAPVTRDAWSTSSPTPSGSTRTSPSSSKPRSIGSAVRSMAPSGPVQLMAKAKRLVPADPPRRLISTSSPPSTSWMLPMRPATTSILPSATRSWTCFATSGAIRCRCTSHHGRA
jgi:hypothetical protein